jgi:ABC-type transport system involved in multi-copper enzyme maturation permease subunit
VTYVEWLRVSKTLKRTAITLGIIVLVAVAARIWLSASGPVDAVSYVAALQRDPASHVTTSTLPDGSHQTTVDNVAKGVHIVAIDMGNGHEIFHIRRSKENGQHLYAIVGNVEEHTHDRNGGVETTIETNGSEVENSAIEFGIAGFIALIAGMILGGCFSRENDGHLEIAMTKPISRTTLAVQTMLVDCVGIVAVWVLGVIATYAIHLLFLGPHFAITARDCLLAAVVILGAIAWYALLCCSTASMKRNYGVVLGTAWILGQLIPVLAQLSDDSPAIFLLLRTAARPLAWIDPFNYARISIVPQSTSHMLHTLPYQVDIPVLVALTLVYAACAIVQWRRVEA